LQSKRIETTESFAKQAYTSISSAQIKTTVPNTAYSKQNARLIMLRYL